jgi:hypothetical protein
VFKTCNPLVIMAHIQYPKNNWAQFKTASLQVPQFLRPRISKPYCILCGPSIIDYPETSGNLRKPAASVSGRFPNFFINKEKLKKIIQTKKFGNLPETCWKLPRFPEVSRRFPDNPSLTDHTVYYHATKESLWPYCVRRGIFCFTLPWPSHLYSGSK